MKRKAIISVVLCIVLTVAVITVYFCVTKPNDNELFRSRIDGLMPIEKVTLYEGDYYRQTEETDVIQDILEVVYSNIGTRYDAKEEIMAPPPGGDQLVLCSDSGEADIVFVFEQDYIPCDFYCRINDHNERREEVFCFNLKNSIKGEVDRLLGKEKAVLGCF